MSTNTDLVSSIQQHLATKKIVCGSSYKKKVNVVAITQAILNIMYMNSVTRDTLLIILFVYFQYATLHLPDVCVIL